MTLSELSQLATRAMTRYDAPLEMREKYHELLDRELEHIENPNSQAEIQKIKYLQSEYAHKIDLYDNHKKKIRAVKYLLSYLSTANPVEVDKSDELYTNIFRSITDEVFNDFKDRKAIIQNRSFVSRYIKLENYKPEVELVELDEINEKIKELSTFFINNKNKDEEDLMLQKFKQISLDKIISSSPHDILFFISNLTTHITPLMYAELLSGFKDNTLKLRHMKDIEDKEFELQVLGGISSEISTQR